MRLLLGDLWSDISMLHWHVDASRLDLGPTLVDRFDGQAWLSVVAFHARGMRAFGVVPVCPGGPQVNVRTYTDRPKGVRFLDVRTTDRVAAVAARRLRLPYRHANVRVGLHQAAAPGLAFAVSPNDEATGPLDRWLVDRFVTTTPRTTATVTHLPMHIRRATSTVWDQALVAPWVEGRPPDLAHVARPVAASLRVAPPGSALASPTSAKV